MRPYALALIGMFTLALSGCGGDSNRCDCSRYLNEVPLYPNDTQDSCSDFGKTFGCGESTLVACSKNPQKQCCIVSKCSSACSCPQE